MPPGRKRIEDLLEPPDRKLADDLGTGWVQSLCRLRHKHQGYQRDIPLAYLVRAAAVQTRSGAPRCAAAGSKLYPEGVSGPAVTRVNHERGDEPGNLALVSKGYMKLFLAAGKDHGRVTAWIREAAEFLKRNPGWSVANHPDDMKLSPSEDE